MRPRRPEPIDVSRSRSKSPCRSILSDILQPRRRPASETIPKIKVLTASGELVEPKTPPGPPPYLKSSIKRPIIRIGLMSKYKLS